MRKIHVNFMKDLRNHEFEELYCIIIDYMDKLSLEDDSINTAFENVKAHKKSFINMRRRSPSRFSKENKKLTHLRNEYLVSLRLRVRSFLLTNVRSERKAAKEVQIMLDSYGREFYVPTIVTQSLFADNLKSRLKKNKNFREAISLLHLRDLLDDIIEMTIEIKENHRKRINENHKIKSNRKGVREEAYRDMKIMADTINVAILIHRRNKKKKAVVEDLISSINIKLKDFHTLMKSRSTKRRNKNEEETAVDESPSSSHEKLKQHSEEVANDESISGLNI